MSIVDMNVTEIGRLLSVDVNPMLGSL